MSFEYMLDTNIVSDAMRDPRGIVARRIQSIDGSLICCSIVVAAELRFGAEKHGGIVWIERVDQALSALSILPLGAPVDEIYGKIRASLARAGTPIGPNDLLIAAHALSHGMILVTANEREFRRVEGLVVENWQNQPA